MGTGFGAYINSSGTPGLSGFARLMAHGLLGAGSLVNGVLLAGPLALLVVLGECRGLAPNICDGFF
ncbi:hypothetical protein XH99_14150 [Bradyrhizobium nanningense]|uniref:Uncharacterized protein n=1 Tax=Bradyrhizobium nanningense TaxID=1325118 RepID=A0A4V1L278_9BRAD|nr:hypothetical protein XH99_14150 [Bradyrhizobium nanningense]